MQVQRLLSVLLIAVLTCGCQNLRDRQMESSVARDQATALSKIDKSACRAKGGYIRSVGMFGTPVCAVPFADAGKACSDKLGCTGKCLIYNNEMPEGTPATGQCQRDDHLDGCWSEVAGGKVASGWCVD